MAASEAPLDAESGAEVHWQAWIADGRDVLLAQQVFCLGVDLQPSEQPVASTQVEFGETEIEVAIGQDKGVPLLQIFISKEGGVVAAEEKADVNTPVIFFPA